MWTCIECEHHFDSNTGDVDERMCEECMNHEDECLQNILKSNKTMIDDFFGYLDDILNERKS